MRETPKIISVKSEIIGTPLEEEEFITSYGVEKAQQLHVMTKITSEEGVFGVGEAALLPSFTGETPEGVKLIIDEHLKQLLLDRDPFNLGKIHKLMDQTLPHNPSAKAAVDIALHDLIGKLTDLPLYKLLGGQYRDKIDLAWAIGIKEPQATANDAQVAIKKGFNAVKLKIGLNPRRDIEAVAAVRDAIGGNATIRVDANQGYTPQEAITTIQTIQKYEIEYVEQPISAWNIKGLARIRNAVHIPILADESVHTLRDALNLVKEDAIDLFGIKLIKMGGLYKAGKIIALAEANDIECVIISPWETSVGIAAGVHLAVASENANHPHELDLISLKNDPATGLHQEKGVILLPEGSGLGIDYPFG